MSYYTTLTATTVGEPWQDGSISLLRNTYEDNTVHPEPDGTILVSVSDYSSEVNQVFTCANEASMQYFVHRFSRAIDSWHDAFAVGTIAKFTLTLRPDAGDGDQQLTSEIEFGFAGWTVSGDDSNTIYADLDTAIEVVNRPINQ